jgi:hypothetical protein
LARAFEKKHSSLVAKGRVIRAATPRRFDRHYAVRKDLRPKPDLIVGRYTVPWLLVLEILESEFEGAVG